MKRRTNKIKKMMTAGLVCTTMILTVGCAEQTVVKEQEAESLPVIVVGSDNYPPFNYLNADGDPTGIDVELAQRIIDFTSGACYSLGGSLQKVSSYIFVLGPYNVDITGDLQNILGGSAPSVRAGY